MFPEREFIVEEALRPFDVYDRAAAQKLFASFGDHTHEDIGYHTDPRFEQGVIMEKRSDVLARFWAYVAGLYEQFDRDARNLPDVIVHITHFEVLGDLAATIGETNRIGNCGYVTLELSSTDEVTILTKATFGDKSITFKTQSPTKLFRRAFGSLKPCLE